VKCDISDLGQSEEDSGSAGPLPAQGGSDGEEQRGRRANQHHEEEQFGGAESGGDVARRHLRHDVAPEKRA